LLYHPSLHDALPIFAACSPEGPMMSTNSFNSRDELTVGERTYEIHRLDRIPGSQRLPYSLKVLLENLLRNEDGRLVTAEQIAHLDRKSTRLNSSHVS